MLSEELRLRYMNRPKVLRACMCEDIFVNAGRKIKGTQWFATFIFLPISSAVQTLFDKGALTPADGWR
jgi:hypothetical protein